MNASVLLAGAIVLYPIIGYITDRVGPDTPRTTFQLFFISSLLTLFAYVFLSLPVKLTHTPWPGLITWALGHGASPLLLVVMVARILPVALVPLGLGLHKALEVSASTSSQTLSGLWLDWAKGKGGADGSDNDKGADSAAQSLLVIYAGINIIQAAIALGLWRFESNRRHAMGRLSAHDEYEQLPLDESGDEWDGERDGDDDDDDTPRPHPKPEASHESGLARTDAERARGRLCFRASLVFTALVWVLWIATAVKKL